MDYKIFHCRMTVYLSKQLHENWFNLLMSHFNIIFVISKGNTIKVTHFIFSGNISYSALLRLKSSITYKAHSNSMVHIGLKSRQQMLKYWSSLKKDIYNEAF